MPFVLGRPGCHLAAPRPAVASIGVPVRADAVVHLDEKTVLEPLDASEAWTGVSRPRPFPSGV